MSVFRHGERHKSKRSIARRVLLYSLTLFIVVISSFAVWFKLNIGALDSSNEELIVVTINSGTDEASISKQLEEKGIIKSSIAYQFYARLNGAQGNTQAGTYNLSPSMPVSEIINKLVNGEVAVDLITILPAQRLDELREMFSDKGYSDSNQTVVE